MSNSNLAPANSPGARLRAAVAEERPLQAVGAITAYTARMAAAVGFKALYLSGGGVAANSLGVPDLGISTLDDVLTDIRRITDACALPLSGRCGHRMGRSIQHRPHRQILHQGRCGGPAYRRSSAGEALRTPSGQGSRVETGDGGPRQSSGGRAHRSAVRHHGPYRCPRGGGHGQDARARRGLRRGRRRHGVSRGDDRPRDVPAIQGCRQGPHSRQYHGIRSHAACTRATNCPPWVSTSFCIAVPRIAR